MDETGRLGRIQLYGDGARAVKKTDGMKYGTGAFLMVGSEIYKFGQRRGQLFLKSLQIFQIFKIFKIFGATKFLSMIVVGFLMTLPPNELAPTGPMTCRFPP